MSNPGDTTRVPARVADVPVAAALACISLALSLLAAQRLEDLRILAQSDIWFHADPGLYRWWFTDRPVVSVRHPLLALLVFGPLVVLSKILVVLGLGDGNDWLVRQWLVLLLVPAANAVRTLLLFSVFRRLTKRLWPAVLLCVIDIASFSNIVTGFLPESFPFTAACTAGMLWMSTSTQDGQLRVRLRTWILLGTLSVGVTTTNLIPLVALLGTTLLRAKAPFWRAVSKTATVSAVALLLNGGVVALASYVGRSDVALQSTRGFFHPPTIPDTKELLYAVGHAFIAPVPEMDPVLKSRRENPDYEFAFSYRHPYPHGLPSLWRALLTAAVVGLGAAGFQRALDRRRLLLGVAVIVLGNVAFLSVWGDHYLVYSLHWSGALLVVMSGVAHLVGPARMVGATLLTGFACITIVNSWIVWQFLTATLSSA